MKTTRIIMVLVLLVELLSAKIDLYKFENKDANTTLLVIGGIHGNEPGGYFAPAILTKYYTITSNDLWVIPNLNKASIQANKRGVNGDMNRKFAHIKKGDKDKAIVLAIKKLILNKQVSLILNLHDGHGFYRKKYDSTVFNPNAWGQSCVIDQCKMKNSSNQEYKDLANIASKVTTNINKRLLKKHHKFNVKNTKTKFDDEAMQLSLTYYAVTNNKPAFAIETSKNLSTVSQKVFYQLLAIEEFMKIMHIHYIRHFQLTDEGIQKILKEYGTLNINDNISLNLTDIKKHLSYIPLKSKGNQFKFTHPLGSVKKTHNGYQIYVGNKILTTLKPQFFLFDTKCGTKHKIEVDGKILNITYDSKIYVKKYFKVLGDHSTRVNIIGFSRKNHKDESDFKITLKDLNKRYSIDKKNREYRIEFYNKDKFCSMSVVHFK